MNAAFLAIINPAAGGGKCARLAPSALEPLRRAGLHLHQVHTSGPGQAASIARDAYARGLRNFLAVGGDGTAFEIVNGLFPEAAAQPPEARPALGFLPLGTGNSFLRDFTFQGAPYSLAAIINSRRRPCDVFRLVHSSGQLCFINLLSMGFAADVASVANRHFKSFGQLGYLLAVLVCLARLRCRAFPLRVDAESDWDRRPALFLSFNNSKFTGGNMMIAPKASTDDGLIEYVRWGPIGRIQLLRNFPSLFNGTHIHRPQALCRAVRRIEFDLPSPVDVMIDGEVRALRCAAIDVLPRALDVFA